MVLGARSLVGRYVLPEAADRGLSALGLGRKARTGAWVTADLAAPDLEKQLPELSVVICAASLWVLPPALEALAARGKTPQQSGLEEMDGLWNAAKAAEGKDIGSE